MKSPLNSYRIQKPLAALRAAGHRGLTPLELNQQCGSTRASSDLSELRQNGFNIEKTFDGTTEAGRKVWRYVLQETNSAFEPVK
jgi:hypothetical protein